MQLSDLPIDIFKHIIAYTLPPEASELDPATFRVRCSTVNVQLVNHTFRNEVHALLHQSRPLLINIYSPGLLKALLQIQTQLPTVKSLHRAVSDHRGSLDIRVQSLRDLDIRRFRRVHVHLVPLLAPINVTVGDEHDYFRIDWSIETSTFIRQEYRESLDLQHDGMWADVQVLKHALGEAEEDYSSLSSGLTSVQIWCHDGPQDHLSKYHDDLKSQRVSPGPIGQLTVQPTEPTVPSLELLPNVPQLPYWSPHNLLRILDMFYEPLYLVQLHFPNRIACLQHDRSKTAAWHHNYWRSRVQGHQKGLKHDDAENADNLESWVNGQSRVVPLRWGQSALTHGRLEDDGDDSDTSSDSGTENENDLPQPTHTKSASYLIRRREFLPRLTLLDINSPLLQDTGCTCASADLCCSDPVASGCKDCNVCNTELLKECAIASGSCPLLHGEDVPKAYEVNTAILRSPLATLLKDVERLVTLCYHAEDFNYPRLGGERGPEYTVEQKAMEYIMKAWQAQLLTKAVPNSDAIMAPLRANVRRWTTCVTACLHLAENRHHRVGLTYYPTQRCMVMISEEEYREAAEEARRKIRERIEVVLGW